MKISGPSLILWPEKNVRSLLLALAVSLVLLALNALWPTTVEPVRPVALEQLASPAGPSEAEELDSLDFIFRPLFYSSRAPQVAISASVEAEPSPADNEEAVIAKALEAYTLLGIFSSGEVSGVILQGEGNDRHRVYEDDRFEGWTLEQVTSRQAAFRNGASEVHYMELAVASSLPALQSSSIETGAASMSGDAASESVAESSPTATTDGASSNPGAGPKLDRPQGAMTFASMRERKRQQSEERRRAAGLEKVTENE